MKIEIPEKYRIQILDVICACEDDMERVAFCWQFAQNYAKEKADRITELEVAIKKLQDNAYEAAGTIEEADLQAKEMGTKNAELYDAWEAVSKDKDRFVKALETCMYYSDPFRVHTDLDYDIIHKTAQKELQAK